jgi:hypothetical protein
MKYFYDIEFIEGTQDKTIFGLVYKVTKPTIDIISIGIISEDNREYYSISKDFNLKEAWNRYDIKQEWYSIDENTQSTRNVKVYWIRENVLKPIFEELSVRFWGLTNIFGNKHEFEYSKLEFLINTYGKHNEEIANEIKNFVNPSKEEVNNISFSEYQEKYSKKELYGYYSSYDHVALCWLFGKMIDLPKGFPMHTIDLKQILDEKQIWNEKTGYYKTLDQIKSLPNYPTQENEHNSLEDARWNKKLYEFLKTI